MLDTRRFIPDDSSWKTPIVSARQNKSKVKESSMGILEMSIEAESGRLVLIRSRVLSIVERFCKPRKSNLTAPWSSAYFIGYIDCSTPSFPVQTGITSRIS